LGTRCLLLFYPLYFSISQVKNLRLQFRLERGLVPPRRDLHFECRISNPANGGKQQKFFREKATFSTSIFCGSEVQNQLNFSRNKNLAAL
jgi:hypothetical protein